MAVDVVLPPPTHADRLLLRVSEDEHSVAITLLLRGLLATQWDKGLEGWLLTWPDFLLLRERLDAMGVRTGRTATPEAVAWMAAQAALDQEIERIRAGAANDQVLAWLEADGRVRTRLYHDQVTGVAFLLHNPRAVLADEMGTGKSLMMLGTFSALRAQGLARHALVLCPNSVKSGWVKQAEQHTSFSVRVLGNGRDETFADFWQYVQRRADLLVVHYDALVNPQSAPKRQVVGQKHEVVPWSPLTDELLRLEWDLVLVDEAHLLKTPGTKRTRAGHHLFETARSHRRTPARVVLATGTPVSESPLDAWSVLSVTSPALLPASFSRFEGHFVQRAAEGRPEPQRRATYRNLGDLKHLLHRSMIRRLKGDMSGFPPKVEQVRYVQMHGVQRGLYDDIRKGLYDSMVQDPADKLTIAFAMTKLMRLRQVLNHPQLVGRPGESAKYEVVDEILDELLADPLQKVVLWTEWREAADLLAERYGPKWGAIKLVGGTSQDDLTRWSRTWDDSPERVAVAIPAFGGTGIDFLNRCRTAVYLEPPYSTIQFRQSMDRIHRRTADKPLSEMTPVERLKASPATIVFLQVERSIDDLVYRVLGQKGAIVDALLIEDEKLARIGREELLAYLR
jgi:SNF2 family DNA or RNA helicase